MIDGIYPRVAAMSHCSDILGAVSRWSRFLAFLDKMGITYIGQISDFDVSAFSAGLGKVSARYFCSKVLYFFAILHLYERYDAGVSSAQYEALAE